jgi:tyrosyl-tRNA synthetase
MNQATGIKFGKSEDGAIWLDPLKTSPLDFYQFWINSEDLGVISYLKIFTGLDKKAIDEIEKSQHNNPADRMAQKTLAFEVTKLVHGEAIARNVQTITKILTGEFDIDKVNKKMLSGLRGYLNLLTIKKADQNKTVTDILVLSGLALSKTEARRLLETGSVYLNNAKINNDDINFSQIQSSYLMMRRGKAYKDTVFLEIKK